MFCAARELVSVVRLGLVSEWGFKYLLLGFKERVGERMTVFVVEETGF